MGPWRTTSWGRHCCIRCWLADGARPALIPLTTSPRTRSWCSCGRSVDGAGTCQRAIAVRDTPDPAATVLAITGGRGAHVVYDATTGRTCRGQKVAGQHHIGSWVC